MHHDPLSQERAINLSILTSGTNKTLVSTNWERPRGHHPWNQEKAIDLSILTACQNLVSFLVLRHWAAGSTPGWCPRGHPPKLGQHWLPSHWSFDPILSASDGTGGKREDEWARHRHKWNGWTWKRVNRVDHVQETVARPMSGGLEFDVKLAQHTAVDVLPGGDAETKPGCDGMSEARWVGANVSHDKRQTTTEPGPYPPWSVRTGGKQHVPDSIACTQNQPSRVGVGCGATRVERGRPQPPSHTLSKVKKKKRIRWHCSFRITLITSTFCSWRLRGTSTGAVAWRLYERCTTRFCTRSRGTCCTPSKICGTRSATICSTTICSRLVTSHGRRGTQHHNVCYEVNRAPCESHDNLSEDIGGCKQPATFQGWPKWKERVSCEICEIHKARLLQPCSPNAPSHSDDWLLQLSASLAANSRSAARDLCVSATSFLRALHHNCVTPAGSVLSRSSLSKWQFPPSLQRVPYRWPCGPHPPFGRPSTASECQWSRRSVVRTPDWHRAAKKENSVERSSSETLFIEHSSQRKGGHGYFCRLPAPVFSPLWHSEHCAGNHIVTVTLAVYRACCSPLSHSELCMDTWLP